MKLKIISLMALMGALSVGQVSAQEFNTDTEQGAKSRKVPHSEGVTIEETKKTGREESLEETGPFTSPKADKPVLAAPKPEEKNR